MWGVRTHISNSKINITCTTALNNIPDTLRLAPSRPRILVSCAYIFHAFFKFPTTAGQLSPPTVKTLPNYLNQATISSSIP